MGMVKYGLEDNIWWRIACLLMYYVSFVSYLKLTITWLGATTTSDSFLHQSERLTKDS